MGEVMFNLGYLIIIGPVIFSGFGLTIHSYVMAWKRRTFPDLAVAGWNTFAQFNNVYQAARHAPGAWDSVLKGLTGGKSKDKGGAIIILLVILALVGGTMTTIAIVRKADREYVENLATNAGY